MIAVPGKLQAVSRAIEGFHGQHPGRTSVSDGIVGARPVFGVGGPDPGELSLLLLRFGLLLLLGFTIGLLPGLICLFAGGLEGNLLDGADNVPLSARLLGLFFLLGQLFDLSGVLAIYLSDLVSRQLGERDGLDRVVTDLGGELDSLLGEPSANDAAASAQRGEVVRGRSSGGSVLGVAGVSKGPDKGADERAGLFAFGILEVGHQVRGVFN